MTNQSSFRGYWAIDAVRKQLRPVVERLDEIGKHDAVVSLFPVDFDLVRRWPKAASIHGFTVTDDGVYFQGHPVTRYVGIGRYEAPQESTQAVIE